MSDENSNSQKWQVIVTFNCETQQTHIETTDGVPLALAQMMVDEAARFLDDQRKDARIAMHQGRIAKEQERKRLADLALPAGRFRQ